MYQNQSNAHTSTEFNLSCTFGMLVGNFFKKRLQFKATGDNEARLHMLQQLELNQTVNF